MADAVSTSREEALLIENAKLREALAALKLAASNVIDTFEGRTALQWSRYAKEAEARELELSRRVHLAIETLQARRK